LSETKENAKDQGMTPLLDVDGQGRTPRGLVQGGAEGGTFTRLSTNNKHESGMNHERARNNVSCRKIQRANFRK